MSSPDPYSPAASQGRRWLPLLLTMIAALALGVALSTYIQHRGFDLAATFGLGDKQANARQTNEAAAGYVPAQPLGLGGQTPAIDPATLVTREAALAGQLTALEARTAAVATDAAAAGAQASRAEALMVAFAARRAIDRGTALGYLEEQLRSRFVAVQPRAVAVIMQAAHQPVTIEDLRQGLDAIAPALQTGADRSWLDQTRRELGNLVVLRKEGTPSAAPVDRLARARRLLDDGQVDAARGEVMRLPGAGEAGAWLAAARRYTLAHQALDIIETAAILGQAQPTAAPPRTAAPAATAAPVSPGVQTTTETSAS